MLIIKFNNFMMRTEKYNSQKEADGKNLINTNYVDKIMN